MAWRFRGSPMASQVAGIEEFHQNGRPAERGGRLVGGIRRRPGCGFRLFGDVGAESNRIRDCCCYSILAIQERNEGLLAKGGISTAKVSIRRW
jgi:hypothetical protein